jgi:hypothetical protein
MEREGFRELLKTRKLPATQWAQIDLFIDLHFTTMVLWSSALLKNDTKRVAEYEPWGDENGNKLMGYFNR